MSDKTTTSEIPASEIHPESLEALSQETGVPVNEIDGAGGVTEAPKTVPPQQTLQEMIAGIDITEVTFEQIFRELIGAIQNVAITAQIALGIAERVKIRDLAAAAAQEEVPVVTPELEVV